MYLGRLDKNVALSFICSITSWQIIKSNLCSSPFNLKISEAMKSPFICLSSKKRIASFILPVDKSTPVALQAIHHTDLGFILKNDGYFCFIVSKESNINQLEQLKEKNIAVSRNTVIEYATDQLLSKAGISLSEMNMPEIGQLPLRLQMLQYNQIDASFLPDPAASIAMNSQHRSLVSTQELGIDFTATAFSRKALNQKRKEIELLITGYNLGVDYIKMHPQKEWEQVLIEIGVPENLTGLVALPNYQKAKRPSAEAIDKAIHWLKENHRIPQTYSEKNLIDTTFIPTVSTIIQYQP